MKRIVSFACIMALDMLCAYYDKSCDSRQLFEGLAAQNGAEGKQHTCVIERITK